MDYFKFLCFHNSKIIGTEDARRNLDDLENNKRTRQQKWQNGNLWFNNLLELHKETML
jgi:hypothetical protein